MGKLRAAATGLAASAALAARAGEPAPAAGPAGPPAALVVALPAGPGVWRGFDRDLFALVAGELGRAFAPVEGTAEEGLRLVDAGRATVAAGPYRPAEAGPRGGLAPVAAGGDALLKRRGDGALLRPGDAAGKRVEALPGPGGGAAARRAALMLGARAAPPRALADPYADLAAGRVAALAGPVEAVAAAALARPDAVEVVGPPFGPGPGLAPALRAGDPMRGAVAAALLRLRADGRLAALQRRWFGTVLGGPDVPGP